MLSLRTAGRATNRHCHGLLSIKSMARCISSETSKTRPGSPVPTWKNETSHRYAFLRQALEQQKFERIQIIISKRKIFIRCGDGRRNTAYLNFFWLRDNCQCDSCVSRSTMQKNYDTFKIPENILPRTARIDENGLEVMWSDGHVSIHSIRWLEHALLLKDRPIVQAMKRPKYFDAESIQKPPEVLYGDVMEDSKAMGRLTRAIRERGFCFVTAAPPTPETTEKLLEKIGPIRNTHYGGFYDFTPNMAMADTAYTNIALPAHTDTTYFTEPAGLQAFHMISHTPPPGNEYADGLNLGGESLLVDGFRAAAIMKKQHPREYEALCSTPIPWHASGNDNISITPYTRFPVIETTTGGSNGQVRRIRWNNDDRGVVPGGINSSTAWKWYKAARLWNNIITDPQSEMWYQLDPTRIIIFDNWRALHGRKAFEGVRRICGAYINRDDFDSRWKTSNWPREEVLAHNYFLDLQEGQREAGIFRPERDDKTVPKAEGGDQANKAALPQRSEERDANKSASSENTKADATWNGLADELKNKGQDQLEKP